MLLQKSKMSETSTRLARSASAKQWRRGALAFGADRKRNLLRAGGVHVYMLGQAACVASQTNRHAIVLLLARRGVKATMAPGFAALHREAAYRETVLLYGAPGVKNIGKEINGGRGKMVTSS